ncbi:MAG: hypothetical protein IJ169_07265 [Paludibacteraceae bacterium]|nr:hypothetical protein [Paludibacteraceae bacterium]
MRKTVLFVLLLLSISLEAVQVPYCLTASFGYGAAATGGGDATPVLVSSVDELETAMKKKDPAVVIITKNLTFTSQLSIKDVSNKTLMGLPGVTLTSLEETKDNSGILFFRRVNNLIIRNLTFIGPGACDINGNDLLCFEDVTDAWVDHCDFQDGIDGNFDNKGGTDSITVSWCRFRYLKAPKTVEGAETNDHRFSNLLGSGASDAPADGTYNFTWAYCWWDEGCKQRMVRARNASLHFLNCYWKSSVADYYIGPENVDAYVEGCYLSKLSSARYIFYQNFNASTVKNGVRFVNSYYEGGALTNVTNRTVVVPAYTYTALGYTAAKTAVTNSTCGAGATLVVDTKGAVSASCTDDVPDQPVTPVTGDLTWKADDSDIASLGTLTSNVTVRGLTIAASSSKTVEVTAASYSYGDLDFTAAIKLGGGMSNAGRYVSFPVTGACTIDIYCLSTSKSDARTVNLAAGTWNNNLKQFEGVTGLEVNRLTYEYTGAASTLFFGSSASGLYLLGINRTYKGAPTAAGHLAGTAPAAQKRIDNGRLLIVLPDGRCFAPDGRRLR